MPTWALDLFLQVDHDRRESLVAIADDGKVVGHAMYVMSEDGREADLGILVEDAWQSRGLGTALLAALAREARRQGVETFGGSVLTENRKAVGLLRSAFAEASMRSKSGTYLMRASLASLEQRRQDCVPKDTGEE